MPKSPSPEASKPIPRSSGHTTGCSEFARVERGDGEKRLRAFPTGERDTPSISRFVSCLQLNTGVLFVATLQWKAVDLKRFQGETLPSLDSK
eukprot:7509221-Pyramimonas_sp.AAC.1